LNSILKRLSVAVAAALPLAPVGLGADASSNRTHSAALADFDDIYDYIARDNPRAAAQVLRSLDESIQLLSDQPKMGKVFRHRRLRLRLLTHDDYLVFYRERPGVIEIVRVIHGRRNIPDILDEL
jgi:toxin ParE1/3/4